MLVSLLFSFEIFLDNQVSSEGLLFEDLFWSQAEDREGSNISVEYICPPSVLKLLSR